MKNDIKEKLKNPNKEVKTLIEDYYIKRVIKDELKTIVEKYQTKVLKFLQFKDDEDNIILKPSLSYNLNNKDFKIYHNLIRMEQLKVNLYTSEKEFCPLLVAKTNLTQTENKILKYYSKLLNVKYEYLSLDDRKQLLDLILKYNTQYFNINVDKLNKQLPLKEIFNICSWSEEFIKRISRDENKYIRSYLLKEYL